MRMRGSLFFYDALYLIVEVFDHVFSVFSPYMYDRTRSFIGRGLSGILALMVRETDKCLDEIMGRDLLSSSYSIGVFSSLFFQISGSSEDVGMHESYDVLFL